jgi:hypothetical protein
MASMEVFHRLNLSIYYNYANGQNINAKMATSTILFELSYLYGNEGSNFCFWQHKIKILNEV